MTPLHTSTVTAKGGREGFVRSENGVIDLPLTMPKVLGGKGAGQGTNPEELFAAGYAACFANAAIVSARKLKLDPAGLEVEAKVDLGRLEDGTFGLGAELMMTAPQLTTGQAQAVIDAAHERCPYSRATRGNIEVALVARGGAVAAP
jgi:lipoyl-dependent peroxiredoxin